MTQQGLIRPRDKGNNFRVVFAAISGKSGGAGHVTRALAIRNALRRLGYSLDGSEGIEYWLGGAVDDEQKWDRQGDARFKFLHDDGVPAYPTFELLERRKHEMMYMLDLLKADLLLIDNSMHYLDDMLRGIYGYTRPNEVWGIARYFPQAYQGVSENALDRLYQIERFEPAFYNGGMCRNRTRSQAEKAGGAHEAYVPSYDNSDEEYTSGRAYQRWQAQHAKFDRKLIAPVVDVDPASILARREAQDALIDLLDASDKARISASDLELIREGRKYIILATGRPGSAAEEIDQVRYERALESVLKQYAKPVVIRVGMGAQPVEYLYRLLPGADVLAATCGYNLFYEVRYLRQLGLFNGKTHWFALRERIHDQVMRAHFAQEWGSNRVYPEGNGADYLARAILIKAGLVQA